MSLLAHSAATKAMDCGEGWGEGVHDNSCAHTSLPSGAPSESPPPLPPPPQRTLAS